MVSEHSPLLSTTDAAGRLGVAPSRVRALAKVGRLKGRKVGRQWVFSRDDVERRATRGRVVGRPMSPSTALGLLFELSGEPAGWLDRVSRWKALHSQAAGDVDLLVARAARRGARIELRAHSSDLSRIASEPGVVRGGISAASDHEIGLVAPGTIELYVDRQRPDALRRRYSLVPSEEPNVVLHAVDLRAALEGRDVMPLCVVIVDLLESGEPRAVAAARQAWQRLPR